MARPKSLAGSVRQVVYLPFDIQTWLELTAYSVDQGKSPLGAKSRLVEGVLRQRMELEGRDTEVSRSLLRRPEERERIIINLLSSLGYERVAHALERTQSEHREPESPPAREHAGADR